MKKFLILIFLLIPYVSKSTDYYVDPSGDDSDCTCTQVLPCQDPQHVFDCLPADASGDNVIIQTGTYEGEFSITSSGSSGNELTVQASGNVTLTGEEVTGWALADPSNGDTHFTAADGVYYIVAPAYQSDTCQMLIDGKWIFRIKNWVMIEADLGECEKGGKYRLAADADDATCGTHSDTAPCTEYGCWSGIDALFGASPDFFTDFRVYLRFKDKRDPATTTVRISCDRTLKIDGEYEYITIDGFTVESPYVGIALKRGASNVTVQNATIKGGIFGFYIGFADAECAVGCTTALLCENNTLQDSSITVNYFHEHGLNLKDLEDSGVNIAGWLWYQFKDLLTTDPTAINMYNAGANNTIQNTLVYEVWNGIYDEAVETSMPGYNPEDFAQDLYIYRNIVHDVVDDALELSGGEKNCQWNSNIAYDATNSLRFKAGLAGPLTVKNNIFFKNPDFTTLSARVIFFQYDTTATIYVQDNTIVATIGIDFGYNDGDYAPNTEFYNNTFSTTTVYTDSTDWTNNMQASWDYNWFGGGNETQIWWILGGTGNTINAGGFLDTYDFLIDFVNNL